MISEIYEDILEREPTVSTRCARPLRAARTGPFLKGRRGSCNYIKLDKSNLKREFTGPHQYSWDYMTRSYLSFFLDWYR